MKLEKNLSSEPGNSNNKNFEDLFFNISPAQKAVNNFVVQKELKKYREFLWHSDVKNETTDNLMKNSNLYMCFIFCKIISFLLLMCLMYLSMFVLKLGIVVLGVFILIVGCGFAWKHFENYFFFEKNNIFVRNGINLRIITEEDKKNFLSVLQIFLTSDYLSGVPKKTILNDSLILMKSPVIPKLTIEIYRAMMDAAIRNEGDVEGFNPALNEELLKDFFTNSNK